METLAAIPKKVEAIDATPSVMATSTTWPSPERSLPQVNTHDAEEGQATTGEISENLEQRGERPLGPIYQQCRDGFVVQRMPCGRREPTGTPPPREPAVDDVGFAPEHLLRSETKAFSTSVVPEEDVGLVDQAQHRLHASR